MANDNALHKPLNFMTFNIRLDYHENTVVDAFAAPPDKQDPFDPKEFSGEQPWSIRKWKIMDTILLYSPDEPFIHQVLDLEALLGEEYKWIGVGRDDGDKKGELCAIFFKSETLAVESWKTLWLSETPEKVGSIGWDAKQTRVATQALFKRIEDNAKFTVFNTHMDHVGTVAREESSKLILERAREASSEGPVFLMGDLNSTEKDPAFLVLTGSRYKDTKDENDTLANLQELNNVCASASVSKTGIPIRTAEGSITLPTHRVVRPGRILENLRKQQQEGDIYFENTSYQLMTRLKSKGASGTLSGPYGHRNTFTGFNIGFEDEARGHVVIDFIMSLHDAHTKLQVKHFAVLPNQFDDGLYISDHRPVLARISWN
ncbi:hypothetical protein G6F43_002905 [Rhizopus delemar]|nr:hypothetical protein G6F43_002905 [Rhizopus delemar]